MKFEDRRTKGRAGGAAAAEAGVAPAAGGGARYPDAAHAMRWRPRTYVQPVGAQFDRHLLR